jgi:hypothetical protein
LVEQAKLCIHETLGCGSTTLLALDLNIYTNLDLYAKVARTVENTVVVDPKEAIGTSLHRYIARFLRPVGPKKLINGYCSCGGEINIQQFGIRV